MVYVSFVLATIILLSVIAIPASAAVSYSVTATKQKFAITIRDTGGAWISASGRVEFITKEGWIYGCALSPKSGSSYVNLSYNFVGPSNISKVHYIITYTISGKTTTINGTKVV